MRTCLTILYILFFAGPWTDLLSQSSVRAVPAAPYPLEVVQPDGSRIQVLGKGDENFSYTTTLDGFPIVRNLRGIYEYATSDGKDRKVPTGIKASDPAHRLKKETEFLDKLDKEAPVISVAEREHDVLKSAAGESATDTEEGFPATGERRVLLLLISYPDLDSTYSAADFDAMMNEVNYNGTGSFRDYFEGASRGKLSLMTDVSGWYVAANDYLYYGRDNGSDVARELVAEAIDAAEAAGIDFSVYDNDGDGYVDGITVVHSGPGAEQGAQTEYIWSHKSSLGSSYLRTYDGVIIDNYNICPETRSWGMTGIGVFCHEFGHILGLPDLYDSNGGSEGIGFWGLMGSGNWLNEEKTPAGMTAWSLIRLGWTSATLIDPGSHSIEPSVSTATVYRIPTQVANEYFLLENRQQIGQDAFLPGSGLAIWHIDDNIFTNSDETHKMVDLEEADGNDDLDNESNRGDAGDLYPGSSGATEFNSASYPNSNQYSNEPSGININSISEDNLTLSFTLEADNLYNPCDHIIAIGNCNSVQSFSGGGSGVWDNNMCNFSTPGPEQVYSFIAPETGIYSIEVLAASGYMDYGWQSSSCDENGWTCIGDFNVPGTYGSMSWTAGTTYYILVDDEDGTSGEHQFYINCPPTPEPVLVYDLHTVDDDNITSSGNSNGYVDAGETIELSVVLTNTGSVDAHNVSAVLSSTSPYIAITDGQEDYNSILTGAHVRCVEDFDFTVDPDCPEGLVTFSLDIVSDEGSWSDEFYIYVYAEPLPGPCDSIIPILHCDSIQSFAGGGTGYWDNDMCGYTTPGSEQIYSFVAPYTGIYSIEAIAANGYMDYGWRSSSCAETGWTCIGDINSPVNFGNMSWTAGTTYFILVDDENSAEGVHSFHINCPPPPVPELEFESYLIFDDNSTGPGNGDGDGEADAGETIELPVVLRNIGTGDAANVSAVLRTQDPYVAILDDTESWGNISTGTSAGSEAAYLFAVAQDCPEGTVSFTLDITSDEGSWTDQFEVYVYAAPPVNPCDHIIPVEGCNALHTFTGGGGGAWNNNMCNYSTPGSEQIYSFVAPETGIYTIEVIEASGYVDYGWRSSACEEYGWECINDINEPGNYGNMSWTEGETYYILLDDENTTGGIHQFLINCPRPPACEDRYEPNESYPDATRGVFRSLEASRYRDSLSGTIHDEADEDYYRFNIMTEGYLIVNLPDPPADFDVELLGSDGTVLEFSSTSGSEYFQYQVRTPGYHFFHVFGSNGANSCTSYDLHIEWRPSVSLHTDYLLVDDDKQGESSGNGNGHIEAGETIELRVWIRNDGPGDAYDAGVILENTNSDPDIQLLAGDAYIGYIPAGESRSAGLYNTFTVDPDCPEKDIILTLRPYTMDQDFQETINLHIYTRLQDPCSNIIPIEGCGQDHSQGFTSESRTGFRDLNLCGSEAVGTEQIYSFTAPISGSYSIELTGTGDQVLYAWNNSCSADGWNCIDVLSSQQGSYGSMAWTAGNTYYILLKDLDNVSGSHQFHINCPQAVPNLTSFVPEGWEDRIIVSSVAGTNQDTELIAGRISYIDFALANTGEADAGYHRSCIYLNSNIIKSVEFDTFEAGEQFVINDWEYTFMEAGLHTIKLVLDVDNDITEGDNSDNVYEKQIQVNSATSDNDLSHQDDMILYPNPSRGTSILEIHNALQERHLIEIIDPSGRVIQNTLIDNQASHVQTTIDLTGKPAGLYVVRLSNSESSRVKKLILLE